MQTIAEVMTRDVRSIAPQANVRRAAQMMEEMDVGAVPVCEGSKLTGMITDRDIVIRTIAKGEQPDNVRVEQIMSTSVRTCFDDQPVDEVLEQMADAQIRRVPVLDHDTQQLVGIVSLGDLAREHSAGIDQTLSQVSQGSSSQQPAAI